MHFAGFYVIYKAKLQKYVKINYIILRPPQVTHTLYQLYSYVAYNTGSKNLQQKQVRA